jgi:O-acetyl-ADP-ribose deacetylase (regulator of RNase III)/uncharacterized protein YwgA
MLTFRKGDLLNSDAQALVNTVNTVGVMGKGIALQFKNRFPVNYSVYRDACKNGTFKTGELLVVEDGDLMNRKVIINFPTKAHWKGNSTYEYVLSGLKALRQVIIDKKIKSIAIPPLGCGNGGLDWSKVKAMIQEELNALEADIIVYEPNDAIKSILLREVTTKEAKLTPARAMLLYLMFNYEAVGEQSSLFVANKLAYFLQRSGEKLKLNFEAHHYGPYTVQLNHVLLHLNGVYLNGMEQNEAKPFEPLQLNYAKLEEVQQYIQKELSVEQNRRLKDVLSLINRFESTFSLELLATVDFIMDQYKTEDISAILNTISKWSNRKTELFKPEYVSIAVNHLKDYSNRELELV